MSKLMPPLFCNSNFNRDGKKIRAEFIREISDGSRSYRLWRRECESEREYPYAENDKHYLHLEINGYLVPLGLTEYNLIDACGREGACEELYGGKEKRAEFYDALRIQYNETDDYTPFSQAEEKERAVINRIGNDPAKWVEHIRIFLQGHIDSYLRAVKNDGDTFPDFIGAVTLDELSTCLKLRAKYREKAEVRERAKWEREKAEDAAFCEEQNRVAEEQVQKAISILRDGGILDNDWITLYETRYDSECVCIVNYLMQRYHINVPVQTKGWIKSKLTGFIVSNGRCTGVRYRRAKGCKCSDKVFGAITDLINAAKAESA